MKNINSYENFSKSPLHESEELDARNHFEESCLAEGISFMEWDEIREDEVFEKGGFFKALGKLALGGLKNIAGPILKNLGIPGGGAIAGILDKVSQGLGKLKPNEGDKIGAAAKESPELKQVSSVVSSTLDKVLADVKAKGPEALFSKSNRESVLNLAAVMQTIGKVKTQAKEQAAAPTKL